MSHEETIMRLRRNLSRDHDIRVMHIGEPVLGLRIPRKQVSDISREDTDTLYNLLYSNVEQLRPAEIEAVYFIADSDYLQVDTVLFFKTFLERNTTYDQSLFGIDTSLSGGSGNTLASEVSLDEQIPVETTSNATIERESASVIRDKSLAENSHVCSNPFYDSAILKAGKSISLNGKINSSDKELTVMPEENRSLDMFSQVPCDSETGIIVELTPKKYVPGGEYESSAVSFSQEQGSLFPDYLPEKIQRNKQDGHVVAKILNDFARNSQKKKLASGRLKSGRRAEVLTKGKRGRYVRYRMPGEKITDIAIAPTVRAAALHAKDGKIEIRKSDIREKVRRRRISSLINIVFDTSGSMDDHEKIRITTDVVIALLKDAYQKRDRVSLVTYCGRSAELVLPFTSSVEAAKRYLEKVPFGGTTPLASGMLAGLDTLQRELKKEPSAVPIMVLVTDGTANCSLNLGGNIRREIMQVCRQVSQHHINILVIDISKSGSKLSRDVAAQSSGSYYHPGSLSKEDIYSAICDERNSKTTSAVV
ncbi:VWA domain-containing protein [Methanolobus halotolerans]|uniref:VWFA domain-containing protein n=1 Tax=Methanolobus halotolerans TaxID=2052935 RepID=A0A4E0R1G7_9EURY|nr:VWA domain-containing protein [Methanolobus halotolerans]TGC11019.1 hypothetical protein CUN85_02375 [Methanolobus halotolerans]